MPLADEQRHASEYPSRIDRSLQRSLLCWMREAYPSMLRAIPNRICENDKTLYFNLFYLQEHGLCETLTSQSTDGHISWGGAKITAKGIDFLEDDGGLTSILGAVTIKLHADTIRSLLAAKIESSPLPPAEKSTLRKTLAGLSDTALQTGTTDLVQLGLQHIPSIGEWLRTLFGS